MPADLSKSVVSHAGALDESRMTNAAHDQVPPQFQYSHRALPGNISHSEFMHSRLNLLDDQVTINYDLSQPSIPGETSPIKKPDQKIGHKKGKKLSRKDRIARDNNFKEMSQEQIDREIEFENDVELESTMWRVLRDKRSVNNILRRFETKGSFHRLKVNDIVKFGRVNFKLSIIKSDKLVNHI